MLPASIEYISDTYYVYFNREVIGVYDNYRDAELHAHDINRDHFMPAPPMFISI